MGWAFFRRYFNAGTDTNTDTSIKVLAFKNFWMNFFFLNLFQLTFFFAFSGPFFLSSFLSPAPTFRSMAKKMCQTLVAFSPISIKTSSIGMAFLQHFTHIKMLSLVSEESQSDLYIFYWFAVIEIMVSPYVSAFIFD